MWIVKLGGSLLGEPWLRQWLAAVAGSDRDIVVVPGGGPFADAVRAAQERLGFSDSAAHAMAVDAMRQSGRAMCDLCPDLGVAAGVDALPQSGAWVWLPAQADLDAMALPASWAVTSDSLALWVATRLGATGLLLVKSVEPPRPPTLGRCTAAAFVDGCFEAVSREFPGSIRWARANEASRLEVLIGGPEGASRELSDSLSAKTRRVSR